MLGRPLPPAYADVANCPFQERDERTKTEASRRKAGGRGPVESTEARTIVRSLTRRIGSLEARMTRSETVIDRMSRIQQDQMVAFSDVTRNLGRLTESLASLDINEMKREMVGAMRDMMRPSRSCALSVPVPLLGKHHLKTPRQR